VSPVRNRPDALEPADAGPTLAAVPSLEAGDLAAIRDCGLDILLRLGGGRRDGELLPVARYGPVVLPEWRRRTTAVRRAGSGDRVAEIVLEVPAGRKPR
jgi:hypothetical protein